MQSAIIHVSIHHHNTAKISASMASAIGAEVLSVAEANQRPGSSWDIVGPLRWIGGIQRGRPNQHDLVQAAAFAQSSLAKLQR